MLLAIWFSKLAGLMAQDPLDIVRAFYERHPYPPPVNDLKEYRQRWSDPTRRRLDAALYWPHKTFQEDINILVAGCGTSQAARYAMRWPNAPVTAIDISKKSIRETQKLKRKLQLNNLTLHHGGVEEVSEIGCLFDLVICTGVLHHLPNPDLGLSALRSVMTHDAAMQIMVYAPYGRAGIYMLQDYFHRLGVKGLPDAVKQARASLASLPGDHPLIPLLRNSPDFETDAGFADALLNPIDRPYSVPQLFDFLSASGLKFGRWLRQAPYLFACGMLSGTPDTERIERLPAVDQYAAAELLRGKMVEHSAIVYRDDFSADPHALQMGDEDADKRVPLRVSTSLVIKERLPPGAAAILINHAHTFTDLYFSVNAEELRLFHMIDGSKSVYEIINLSKDAGHAGKFLEKLWHYDHIVFEKG